MHSQRELASGLKEAKIVCNVDERDSYLYYLLIKYPGRTMVRLQCSVL